MLLGTYLSDTTFSMIITVGTYLLFEDEVLCYANKFGAVSMHRHYSSIQTSGKQ